MLQNEEEQVALSLAQSALNLEENQGTLIADKRNAHRVAGQLRTKDGSKMFPTKKAKTQFDRFVQRLVDKVPAPGDGAIALALVEYHFRKKLRELAKLASNDPEAQTRLVPGITMVEVDEIFIDTSYDDVCAPTPRERTKLVLLVDSLKRDLLHKSLRTGR